MVDPANLEKYLLSHSGLVPNGVADARIGDVKRISEGITNEVYSFSLFFTEAGAKKNVDLIIKSYPDTDDLWCQALHNETVRRYGREFDILNRLETVGFPASKVYVCEENSVYLGYPFLLMQKEKVVGGPVPIDRFASTLARLHNFSVAELDIKSLALPENNSSYAAQWPARLKQALNKTKHNKNLKKDFDYAINWLERNASNNSCPRYSLIHGEYHPGHTLLTSENTLKVIDWESAEFGDPAFDVGYAYHMVKLMYAEKNTRRGQESADKFVSEYTKTCLTPVGGRLEFYKAVGILGVAIQVSAWISNPLSAYRRFGYKAFARALAFPLVPFHLVSENWLNADFLVSCLQYFQDFIKTL